MASSASKAKAADVLLALIVESIGLAIVVAVAGLSDGLANLMLIFIIGVGLLWMFTHTSDVTALANMIARIEKAGAQ